MIQAYAVSNTSLNLTATRESGESTEREGCCEAFRGGVNLAIQSLAEFEVDLGVARRIGDAERVKFYEQQIAACEKDLGIEKAEPQGSLF